MAPAPRRRSSAARRVLALGVERRDVPNVLAAAEAELERSHHHVESFHRAGTKGKFENLNDLLAGAARLRI